MIEPTNELISARIKNAILVKRWMTIPVIVAMGFYILKSYPVAGIASVLGLMMITSVNQTQRIDEMRLEMRER